MARLFYETHAREVFKEQIFYLNGDILCVSAKVLQYSCSYFKCQAYFSLIRTFFRILPLSCPFILRLINIQTYPLKVKGFLTHF